MDSSAGPGTRDDTRVVAGRYSLLSTLGSGGMGTVWRAHDAVLGREVALKEVTFPPGVSPADRELLQERTRREARAAARLHHPSAITVYDVVEDDGVPFIVMELVHARTLAQVVREQGALSPQRAAEVGLAVLGALEAAHRQGILHRDVKPSNVLLCDSGDPAVSGRVVLTDFGIATSSDDSSITSTGFLLGSPAYIAPERARGQQPGPASDLWSLGATLFTAVEGRAPFQADEPLLTVAAVAHGEHAPFVAAGPMEPLLEGLLERDPERRLDVPGARALLRDVVRGPAAPPAAAAPPQDEDDRTAVLSVGAVRREVAAPPLAEQPPVEERPRTAEAAPAAPSMRPSRPPAPDRRRLVPVLLAVVLLLGGVVAGALALGDDERSTTSADPGTAAQDPDQPADATDDGADDPGGDAAPGPEASADPQPEAADEAPAEQPAASSDGPVPPPEGWETATGGPGWQIAVPPSYAAGTFQGDAQYRDAGTGRTVRVATTGPGGGKDDAVQDRRDQAADFESRYASYDEIAIEGIDFRGYEAADWEFTYTAGGTPLHVLSRVFVVDGRGYSLFFQTRASDDWSAARDEFDRVARSFVPA